MSASITIEALSMHYPLAPRPVLDALDLHLAGGRFMAILGRSGSGKSTLLNILGAMDVPTAGRVQVGTWQLTGLDESARTAFRRTQLGFIFQSFNLMPMLDVRQNVALPLALNGRRDVERVEALLEALDLRALANRYPGELSGGEQQRVAIGRALVHRPSLILADEPTGNLDLETSGRVLALLRGLAQEVGSTLVMATHSLEAAGHADEVWQLSDGRMSQVS